MTTFQCSVWGSRTPCHGPPDLMLEKTEEGEKAMTGQGSWRAPPTQWTWVWANAGRQWRTGKPGVLQPTGSQTVEHDGATEQQQRQQHCSLETTWWLIILMADKINTESKQAGLIFFKSTSCMHFHFWARYFGVA